MGWKFNPFTGALDQTGSTPSSYIDGEVATYNDLPLSSTTAPLDTAWLVRGSSGVWPFTKPGGVYIRTATGGSARDADYTYAGVFPDVFSDANFTLYDDGDTTKLAKFQLSGISAGTTRTLTVPNASGTITLNGHTHIFYGEIVDSLIDGGEQILADIGAAASSHTHDAANITSGTLANARVNFAAPAAIGSTTANTGAFTTLTADNGTLTASAPVLDLSQTWNNAAVTFTGLKLNVTNTASAAASLFESIQLAGNQFYELDSSRAIRLYNTSSSSNANYERSFMRWSSNVLQIGTEKAGTGSARALEFQTDGTTRLTLAANGSITIGTGTANGFYQRTTNAVTFLTQNVEVNGLGLQVSNTIDFGSGLGGLIDTTLARDAANILAMRRSTNAQAFRIYNTVSGTNNVNFDRVNFRWASNEFIIDAEAGGTGTLRGIKIGSATSSLLGFYGATPVTQRAAIADAIDAASTQARLNDLLAAMRSLGLIAT